MKEDAIWLVKLVAEVKNLSPFKSYRGMKIDRTSMHIPAETLCESVPTPLLLKL
jgi:hypothetical protein